MKVLLYGKHIQDLEKVVKDLSFEVVAKNPDVVISYGGDGTLLSAEREYPDIPKLPVRNNQFCKKCSKHQDEVVLKKLLEGSLNLKEHKKLHINIYGKDLYTLNDFVIRNDDATHTIRFKTSSTGDKLFIGDGVVISTPFGSSGYFKSITQLTFDKGSGLAFNNTTEKNDPLYFSEGQTLEFQLIRGKAVLSFDNSPDKFSIPEGTTLSFGSSDQVAKIYEDTSLRCPDCKVIRG